MRWFPFLCKTFIATGIISLIGGVVIWLARYEIEETTHDFLYSQVEKTPPRKVGLVLGAKPQNNYFRHRITAASALYKAGKVSYLIVSGDNRHRNYDEPSEMQRALIAQGVPASVIFCDYAGFTTLDSVVRAHRVFQENDFIIVSQKFHNQRALYLARSYGIEAIGFNARDVSERAGRKTMFREQLARVRAVWDATVFRRQPKFLGAPIAIGRTSQNGCPSPYEKTTAAK